MPLPVTEPVTLAATNNNMDKITIECDKTSATIHKFGATVVSWKVDGQEKLFVSSKAIWDGTKPIRGGIPLVFPQFGTGPILPGQHGFARNQIWKIEKVSSSKVVCTLTDNEQTFKLWPFKFKLVYTVSVAKEKLTTELKVENLEENERSMDFTALLHTYFAIENVNLAKVEGFLGLSYSDKLMESKEFSETRKSVTIACEVDRTYTNVPDQVLLTSSTGSILIEKTGLSDVVLWNPWIEKSKTMADFDDEEYLKMICIEAGSVATPVSLKSGHTWTAQQALISVQDK